MARNAMLLPDEMQHCYPSPPHTPRPSPGQITCWLLDTRPLWQGENIRSTPAARRALGLVSPQERDVIDKKLFLADAKMSLGSALLKRAFVSKTLGVPFAKVRLGRKNNQKHGKPIAVDAAGRPCAGIDFNVTHQAGLVALIGFAPAVPGMQQHGNIMVGADLVCVDENQAASRMIATDGFEAYIDMHDFVFSEQERWSMKYDVDYVTLPDGTTLGGDKIGRHDRCTSATETICLESSKGRHVAFPSRHILDSKLRRFYAYFCLRESYVKLTGEGLLAPWLKKLEFSDVRSPRPAQAGGWGEMVDDMGAKLYDVPVHDVKMKIQALERDLMLSTAIQGDIAGLEVPAFQMFDIDRDIPSLARSVSHAVESSTVTRSLPLTGPPDAA